MTTERTAPSRDEAFVKFKENIRRADTYTDSFGFKHLRSAGEVYGTVYHVNKDIDIIDSYALAYVKTKYLYLPERLVRIESNAMMNPAKIRFYSVEGFEPLGKLTIQSEALMFDLSDSMELVLPEHLERLGKQLYTPKEQGGRVFIASKSLLDMDAKLTDYFSEFDMTKCTCRGWYWSLIASRDRGKHKVDSIVADFKMFREGETAVVRALSRFTNNVTLVGSGV